MIFPNDLTSLIVLDIFSNFLQKRVLAYLHRQPKHISIGYASALLRQWKQYNIIGTDEQKEQNLVSPELPIISLIPTDFQTDNIAFPWHRMTLPKFQRKMSLCLLKTEDFAIRYIPYLYQIRGSLTYLGTSFADITDAKVRLFEGLDTNQMVEEEVTSLITFPSNTIENLLTTEQLESVKDYLAKETIKLIGHERYCLPYRFRYFGRITGLSDTSQLFGEQTLPEYLIALDFEIFVNLPTKIWFEFRSLIETIDIRISSEFDRVKQPQQHQETKPDYNVIEITNLELDETTGSYVIHTQLRGEKT